MRYSWLASSVSKASISARASSFILSSSASITASRAVFSDAGISLKFARVEPSHVMGFEKGIPGQVVDVDVVLNWHLPVSQTGE